MSARKVLVFAAACVFLPGLAAAQEGGDDDLLDDIADEDAPEPEPEGDYLGDTSDSETPGDPKTEFTAEAEAEAEVDTGGAPGETGYPGELIYRPITLPEGMIEAGVALPVVIVSDSSAAASTRLSGLLRGRYGVTREVEVGLRYGLGTVHDSDTTGEGGFATGKALSLDAAYAVTDWVAVQGSVPLFLDPFAMGLTVGAPFQFTFFDKFRLAGGEDLISFKVAKFIPEVGDALINETQVVADEAMLVQPAAVLRFVGRFIYQLSEKGAVDARFGFTKALDSSEGVPDDTPVLLDVGYTQGTRKLDFGARAGFQRLDEPDESLTVTLFMALRL